VAKAGSLQRVEHVGDASIEFVLVFGLVVIALFILGHWILKAADTLAPSKAAPKAPVGKPQGTVVSLSSRNLSHLPEQRPAQRDPDFTSRYLHSSKWDELLVLGVDGLPTLYLQMVDGRLWLTEPTTGLLVGVANRKLRKMGIWTVSARGINCYVEAVTNGAFEPGSFVTLIRESDNDHGGTAVAICAHGTTDVAGYFNKAMSQGLSKLIAAKIPLEAMTLTGDPAGIFGKIDVLAASPEIVGHLLRKGPLKVA
jgi:hypothetical protein